MTESKHTGIQGMRDDHAPRRANRAGDACPAWCRTDHAELLIPGKPSFGHMDGHYSDPIRQLPGAPGAVRLARDPGAGTPAAVSMDLAPGGAMRLVLTPEQAVGLAAVIGDGDGEMTRHDMLAAELRAAAAIAFQVAP